MSEIELYKLTPAETPVTQDSVRDTAESVRRFGTGINKMMDGLMQSQNFLTGFYGWQIDAEGNAEFNDGTFRGTFNLGNTQITVNDAADIQTAINTVSAAGGGIVYIASGTYNITATITLASNVSLVGVGPGVTILDFGGAARYISISGSNGYTTGTVAITNGGTTVTGTGTTFTSAMVGRYIRLQDFWYEIVTFTDTTHISIDSDTPYVGTTLTTEPTLIATIIENVSIRDMTIQNANANGINAIYANNLFISGLICSDITDGANNAAIGIFRSARVFISDIDVNNCDYGISLQYATYGQISNVNASNTLVSGFDFRLNSRNWGFSDLNISTTTTGKGFTFDTVSVMTLDSFSTNNTADQGITMTGSSNIIISKGSINTTTGATQSGINLGATNANIIITGNQIVNSTNYGINVSASTNTDVIIIGNYIFNNSTGGINDLGTRTIVRGNSGGTNGVIESPQTSRVTTQLDVISSTTLVNITGLSARLEAGRAYTFELRLFVDSDSAGGVKISLGGGTATATSVVASVVLMDDALNSNVIVARITSLSGTAGITATTGGMISVRGTIVVNAAGTFIPKFAQNASTAVNSSVLVNSTMNVADSN